MRGRLPDGRGIGKGGVSLAGEDAGRELTFEEALARLEELVLRLEGGELPLEESIRVFEEGQKLLRLCADLLGTAEQRVKEILKRADGGMEEVDWKGDADASA